jgi:hypothetical protein
MLGVYHSLFGLKNKGKNKSPLTLAAWGLST